MKIQGLSLLLVLLTACSADFIPFSGGALKGNLAPAPDDWSEVSAVEVIQLETNPAKPYSVKLWIVGTGKLLYVHAGANRTTWVEHIEDDSRVKLLIGENLYELQAERVTDSNDFKAFSAVYVNKYGSRPRNENVQEVYLFRLFPRS
jgi:hypothetical protein